MHPLGRGLRRSVAKHLTRWSLQVSVTLYSDRSQLDQGLHLQRIAQKNLSLC